MHTQYSDRPLKYSHYLQRGNTLTGVMVGLLVGVVIAAVVALFVNIGPAPFQSHPAQPHPAKPSEKASEQPILLPGKPGDKPLSKPQFDFYKVLPEGENGAASSQNSESSKQTREQNPTHFYLQLGAFSDATDADNLKAQLALMGLEVRVQRVDLEDKGTLHRVRMGPYGSIDDVNKTRTYLAQLGIKANVVKTEE